MTSQWKKKCGNDPNFRKMESKRFKKYYYRRLNELRSLLGNKCAKCGNDDYRVLQVDHIAGGGAKELRPKNGSLSGKGRYTRMGKVILSIAKGERKYQLLCANCNWIKKFKNSEK